MKSENSLKSTNLAPIKADTISFGSKGILLNEKFFQELKNDEICKLINKNAQYAAGDVRVIINGAFSKFLKLENGQPTGLVESIKTRVKSPSSIKEKVAQEIQYAKEKNTNDAFDISNPDEIKKRIGDIIGTRIVLNNPSKKNTSKIIDTLIEEVENGRVKITKIENYEPKWLDSKFGYFKKSDLKRLQDAANKARGKNEPEVKFINKNKKSGYCALHLDVDWSGSKYCHHNNNFKGEIQIMGNNVERLKEIEDFYYKFKENKAIKGKHPAYDVLVEYFNKLLKNNPDYPNAQKDFAKYTTNAFKIQRIRETEQSAQNAKLPTLKECGMKGKLPSALDYNEIEKIVKHCDEIYFQTEHLF